MWVKLYTSIEFKIYSNSHVPSYGHRLVKPCIVSLWDFGLGYVDRSCVELFRSCLLSQMGSSRVDLLRNELCHKWEVRVLIIIGASTVVDHELGLPIAYILFSKCFTNGNLNLYRLSQRKTCFMMKIA